MKEALLAGDVKLANEKERHLSYAIQRLEATVHWQEQTIENYKQADQAWKE